MIVEEAGSHFDPDVIAAFRGIDDATFVRIGSEV